VLVNPWVRTETGVARAQLKHYYVARLFQRSFWQKVLHGELHVGRMLSGVARALRQAAARRADAGLPLPQRMENGLSKFEGPVLLILSGNDLTAQEFKDVVAGSTRWQGLLQERRVTRRELAEANHTFARCDWRAKVAQWTVEWLKHR
jgi:hypothetical protein